MFYLWIGPSKIINNVSILIKEIQNKYFFARGRGVTFFFSLLSEIDFKHKYQHFHINQRN